MMKNYVSIFFLVILLSSSFTAHAQQSLRYKYQYICNNEHIVIDHCRNDPGGAGFFPVPENENYCLVYYPDRPRTGGFTVQKAELRSDIVKNLTACGALAKAEQKDLAEANIPTTADGNYELGNRQMKAKLYEEAIVSFKRSIAIIPMSAAYADMGSCYAKLDRYEEAIAAEKHAIRLKPDNAIAMYNLGAMYIDGKQPANAVPVLLEARKLLPKDALIANHLGIAYYMLKKYPEALVQVRDAVDLDPKGTDQRLNLGVVYLVTGRKDLAMQQYQMLRSLDPKKADELYQEILSVK